MKDYYKILNISESATADQIKAAFRVKAKETHPDQHGGDPKYQSLFNDVVEAYEVLADPQKRAEYDDRRKYGSNPYGGNPYGGSYGGNSYGGSSYGGSSYGGSSYGGSSYGGSSYGGSSYGGSRQGGYSYGGFYGDGSYGRNTSGAYSSYDSDDEDFTFDTEEMKRSRKEAYEYVRSFLRQATMSAREAKAEAGKAVVKGVLAVVIGLILSYVTPYMMIGALAYGALSIIRGVRAYRQISLAIRNYEDDVWRKVEEMLKGKP